MQNIKTHKEFKNKDEIGGKAKGLLFLSKHGFNIPEFFILDYRLVDLIIHKELSLRYLLEGWMKENRISSDSLWAVRSSASFEDGKSNSFAGLFKTEINVGIKDLPNAIEKVISGYIDFNKTDYQPVENLKFAVIIQKMIVAEFSGVIFSHNPNNVKEKNVHINIIPGLGEKLVSGEEDGLSIISLGKKIKFINENTQYSGQVFDNGIKDIVLTNKELKQSITPYLNKLIAAAKKMAKLRKYPVDIEFCIADKRIYWLQLRPITSSKQVTLPTVWDNSNIGENYPGLTTPLSISFVKITYYNAYLAMVSFLGMSKRQQEKNRMLLKNMVGGISGSLYYNITAWQQLLYQLPFGKKTSKQITQILGMDDAEFELPMIKPSLFAYSKLFFNVFFSFLFFGRYKKKFELTYKKVFSKFKDKDYKKLSNKDLIEYIQKLNQDLGAKWIVPVLNGFFAFLLFSYLKKIFTKSSLHDEYPNFINDILYAQGDIVSVVIVRKFHDLLNTILADHQLKNLFKEKNEKDIWQEISNYYPEFKNRIEYYIANYGERCGEGELKIETINYKENPLAFISTLKSNAIGSVQTENDKRAFNYKNIINEKYKYKPLKKYLLLILIKITLNRIKDRENYRFYRTKGFDLVRKIFRAIDDNLYREKLIEQSGDSLYLEYEEIINQELSLNYKQIIREQKSVYNYYQTINRVNRYYQKGNNFIAVERFKSHLVKNIIKGVACSSGVITGELLIIEDNKLKDIDISGKILVAKYFEPGWINLFSKAVGIISERGGLLSHTAILFRELGIPAIVGAKGILSIVEQGDKVLLDGTKGEIKIIKKNE